VPTLTDNTLTALWRELEPNKRNRALAVARILANHGTDAQKAHYTEKIKTETFPCDERDQALCILNPEAGNSWLASMLEATKERPPSVPVQMDVETARLAVALHRAPQFRLWCIGRELTRAATGDGKLTKKAFYIALKGFGWNITRDHFGRLLKWGKGMFWRIDPRTKLVYLNSPCRVVPMLVSLALETNPVLVATNLPGGYDMDVSVSGSHETFEANIYAGWMCFREAPTISRAVLETLFNRDQDTLRRWEQARLKGRLIIRENYAQYDIEPNTWDDVIPEHARPYLARVKNGDVYSLVMRYRWRIPNTYDTIYIRQHHKRGQNRKVSKIVRKLLDQYSGGFPVPAKAGQPTYPIGREIKKLYFDDPKRLERYVRKHGVNERMLWRGEDRHGRGVFEPTLSYGQTYPNERASFKTEYWYFKQLHERIQAHVTAYLNAS
jgi:hypothetical protein